MKKSLSSLFAKNHGMRDAIDAIPQITLVTPNFHKEKARKKISTDLPREHWQGYDRHPFEFLTAVIGFLAPLNREELLAAKRLEMTDGIRRLVCGIINKNYVRYLAEEEFPVPEQRRKTLSASLQILEQIAISYKHLFRDGLKNVRKYDEKSIPLVMECGFRIMEIILVLQRLYALSNRPLPRHFWAELNQIFMASYLLQDALTSYEITGFLKIGRSRDADRVVYSGDQPKNALHLYLSVQFFGLCDAFSWPPQYLHLFEAYISMLRTEGMINIYRGENLEDGQLIIFSDQNRSPSLLLNSKRKAPAIIVDLIPMHKLITTDQNAVQQNAGKPISPALATLVDTDRIPFLQLVRKRLHPQIRMENRLPSNDKCYLRLFHGFRECHHPLSSLSEDRYSIYLKKNMLSHLLAEKSAGIAEDEDSVDAGRWYTMDESPGGLRVRTRETQFTSNIFMGQMVAYQKLDEGTNSKPMLGYICRIQRLEDNDLDLAITKLSTYGEGIFLRDPAAGMEGGVIIGYLAHQDAKRWMLIVHAKFRIKKGKTLIMERGNRQQKVTIGNPVITQREFICYHLQATTSDKK